MTIFLLILTVAGGSAIGTAAVHGLIAIYRKIRG